MGKPRFGQLFGVLSSETTGVQTISGSLTVNGVLIANEISGSGAGLTNIPASGITGLNLSQISSGSVSASISPNNGLRINTNTTIVGDLMIQGTASISYLNVTYESASVIYSSGSNQFGDAADDTQTLYGTVLIQTGSLTVTGSVTSTAGFTGSLFGTSSWATNATTASYILNAVSSSYSATASYVESAQTASYVLNAVSASYAQTASYIQLSGVDGFTNYSSSVSSRVSSLENFSSSLDATFATDAQLNAATASLSSSIASLSSSYLNTSSSFSNGINANSSSISALSSSFISFSASYNTGSFTGSFTGNLQGTSSWAVNAQTASLAPNYVLTSVTSSMLAPYVLTSQTSSMSVASASVATSASYALTASFALNGGGGGSSFPYTGSAIISGSLEVIGDTNLNGNLTLNTNPSTSSLGPGLTTNLLSISSSQVNFDFDELEGDFDLIQTGSQSITGAVTASYFKGDGTEISGISAINWFLT